MNVFQIITVLAVLIVVVTYDDLSQNKVATQSQTEPDPKFYAHNAVDRNSSSCMRTKPIGLNNPDKKVWWKVDLGRVYNIYSINILFKNYDGYESRQRGRFAGFSLYTSNTSASADTDIQDSTLCYKDGPQLPPLNFTTTCTKPGRFVIFYNERLRRFNYSTEYELKNVYIELCEVIVQGCNNWTVYGANCSNACPYNCENNLCHIKLGTCFACKPGWTGAFCKLKCREGWYGVDCNKTCPLHCKESTSCNHTNGQCDNGCANGWYGSKCSQQCSGHCINEAFCNHVTGHCDNGCDAGWKGHFCEIECNNGTYGYDCVNKCVGHCLDDSPCNKKNGHCDMGCKPGYTMSDCTKICPFGTFGSECRERCSGHCINKTCDHVLGVCPGGCQDGYVGTFCNNSCKEGNYGRDCSLSCSPNCKTCRHTDGLCSCKTGWMGNNCSEECVHAYGENCRFQCSFNCINHTCDRSNGSCLKGCRDNKKCDLEDASTPIYLSETQSAFVGATVGAFVLVVIGVVTAVFIIRLRRKTTKMNQRMTINLETRPLEMEHLKGSSHITDKIFQHDHAIEANESSRISQEQTKRGPPTNRNISVRNIKAQIANMFANESAGFKSEYQEIPRGKLHHSLEAKKPENKVKNRYTTIYPYDHSRVILKTLSVDDYINANYIEDARGKRIYIATQGPKPKTIADFWIMIWQEEVCNIVCLTNLKEGAKNKCAQYWPDINDKLQGGTLTVRNLEEKIYAEYIIRRFKIHNKLTKTDRHVTMFHYNTWSDHGVADPLSLVVFHRHVIRSTANSTGKFTVVHCSAGVGRTGTYIALDALYREGEKTCKINVPMYVRTMRKDRMNMIQGDEQYKLLYLALMEAFSGPSRCVTTEKFVGAYQGQTCYANCGDVVQESSQSSEFEELLSLRKKYTEQDYTSGRAQISANYTQSVLPVEEFMCHLSYIKGHNTYYNAVLIQSYLEKDSLISAQYPLIDNTEDFLRLVKDFDARVVVFLCPLKDIESTPTWFPTDNQSKLNGLFFVKNISTTKAPNVTKTKLNIQPQGFSEINITVIECPTWREGKETADKRVLLDVIKAVKTEKSDQEGRIIVLSSDGATRCGPFLVVYNVLEQISVDREVDIFTTTRQLQVRRPEFVSTLEEYQLCHDMVAEFLLNDCVYGNC